jgi:(2Fe-2S) ferredoxin
MLDETLKAVVEKRSIGQYQRHVLMCTGPSCCTPEQGLASWEVLKQHIKQAGLETGAGACYRTKVGCLRICSHGPTMVVYPEGTWYHDMTADKIPRLVQQHLVEGEPVRDWVFADNPLPASAE